MGLIKRFGSGRSTKLTTHQLRLPDGTVHKSRRKIRINDQLSLEVVALELGLENDRPFFFITKTEGELRLLPLYYPSSSAHLRHEIAKTFLLFNLCQKCVTKCIQLENPRDVADAKLINDVSVSNTNGLQTNPDDILASKAILDSDEAVTRLLNILLSVPQLTTEVASVKDRNGVVYELGITNEDLKIRPKFDQTDSNTVSWNHLGEVSAQKTTVRVPLYANPSDIPLFASFVPTQKPPTSRKFGRKSPKRSASDPELTNDKRTDLAKQLDLVFFLSDVTIAKQLACRLNAVRCYALRPGSSAGTSVKPQEQNAQSERLGPFSRLNRQFRSTIRRISRSVSRRRKRPKSEYEIPVAVAPVEPAAQVPSPVGDIEADHISVQQTAPSVASRDSTVLSSTSPTVSSIKLAPPGGDVSRQSPVELKAQPIVISTGDVIKSTAAGEAEAELDDGTLQTLMYSHGKSLIGPPSPSPVAVTTSSSIAKTRPTAPELTYAMGIKPTHIQPVSTYSSVPPVSPFRPIVPATTTSGSGDAAKPHIPEKSPVASDAVAPISPSPSVTKAEIRVSVCSTPPPKSVVSALAHPSQTNSVLASETPVHGANEKAMNGLNDEVDMLTLLQMAQEVADTEPTSHTNTDGASSALVKDISKTTPHSGAVKARNLTPSPVDDARIPEATTQMYSSSSSGVYEPLPLNLSPSPYSPVTSSLISQTSNQNIATTTTTTYEMIKLTSSQKEEVDTNLDDPNVTYVTGHSLVKEDHVLSTCKPLNSPVTTSSFQSRIKAPLVMANRTTLMHEHDALARTPEFPMPYRATFMARVNISSGLSAPKVSPAAPATRAISSRTSTDGSSSPSAHLPGQELSAHLNTPTASVCESRCTSISDSTVTVSHSSVIPTTQSASLLSQRDSSKSPTVYTPPIPVRGGSAVGVSGIPIASDTKSDLPPSSITGIRAPSVLSEHTVKPHGRDYPGTTLECLSSIVSPSQLGCTDSQSQHRSSLPSSHPASSGIKPPHVSASLTSGLARPVIHPTRASLPTTNGSTYEPIDERPTPCVSSIPQTSGIPPSGIRPPSLVTKPNPSMR